MKLDLHEYALVISIFMVGIIGVSKLFTGLLCR
jgi:hypothetical protein